MDWKQGEEEWREDPEVQLTEMGAKATVTGIRSAAI